MKEALANILAQNLRQLRTTAGITQQALASRLGLDRSAYARYESGVSMPSCVVLQRIAQEFGVSTDSLLSVQPTSLTRYTLRQSDLPLLYEADSLSLLSGDGRGEQAFLSLFRRLEAEDRQQVLRLCLDLLETKKSK